MAPAAGAGGLVLEYVQQELAVQAEQLELPFDRLDEISDCRLRCFWHFALALVSRDCRICVRQ
jgi:hypothetical protein